MLMIQNPANITRRKKSAHTRRNWSFCRHAVTSLCLQVSPHFGYETENSLSRHAQLTADPLRQSVTAMQFLPKRLNLCRDWFFLKHGGYYSGL